MVLEQIAAYVVILGLPVWLAVKEIVSRYERRQRLPQVAATTRRSVTPSQREVLSGDPATLVGQRAAKLVKRLNRSPQPPVSSGHRPMPGSVSGGRDASARASARVRACAPYCGSTPAAEPP